MLKKDTALEFSHFKYNKAEKCLLRTWYSYMDFRKALFAFKKPYGCTVELKRFISEARNKSVAITGLLIAKLANG